MLTAARAWVGPPPVRGHGVVGGCGHLRRRNLVMARMGLEGMVTPAPPCPAAVCGEGVEGEAALWIRYSRKRKKRERRSSEGEEEDRLATGGPETKAGKGDRGGAAMGSPPPNLVCSDCGTSRTPLWRKGPAGPKSLCNACGIRYRKARRAGGPFPNASSSAPAAAGGDQRKGDPCEGGNISVSLKLAAAAEEARKQREDRLQRRQTRRQEVLWLLLEESSKFELPYGKEAVEAAVLLMAMSFGLFVRSY